VSLFAASSGTLFMHRKLEFRVRASRVNVSVMVSSRGDVPAPSLKTTPSSYVLNAYSGR